MNGAMSVQLKSVCVCCMVLGMTASLASAYEGGMAMGMAMATACLGMTR